MSVLINFRKNGDILTGFLSNSTEINYKEIKHESRDIHKINENSEKAFDFLNIENYEIKNKYIQLMKKILISLPIEFTKEMSRIVALLIYFVLDSPNKTSSLNKRSSLQSNQKDDLIIKDLDLYLNTEERSIKNIMCGTVLFGLNQRYFNLVKDDNELYKRYMNIFYKIMNKKNPNIKNYEDKLRNSLFLWFSDICYDIDEMGFVVFTISKSEEFIPFVFLSVAYENIINEKKVYFSKKKDKLEKYSKKFYNLMDEDLRSRNKIKINQTCGKYEKMKYIGSIEHPESQKEFNLKRAMEENCRNSKQIFSDNDVASEKNITVINNEGQSEEITNNPIDFDDINEIEDEHIKKLPKKANNLNGDFDKSIIDTRESENSGNRNEMHSIKASSSLNDDKHDENGNVNNEIILEPEENESEKDKINLESETKILNLINLFESFNENKKKRSISRPDFNTTKESKMDQTIHKNMTEAEELYMNNPSFSKLNSIIKIINPNLSIYKNQFDNHLLDINNPKIDTHKVSEQIQNKKSTISSVYNDNEKNEKNTKLLKSNLKRKHNFMENKKKSEKSSVFRKIFNFFNNKYAIITMILIVVIMFLIVFYNIQFGVVLLKTS